ncbi:hypothetical protein AruPA_18975 [Acidiphilium sp. PA]|uniref:hypothetical protein n=1 Tax=Acidiphilium sp. PA TaxID=2871705 RepID=UPI002244BCA7|nr:hypothetical protein [Acidiphilium sp. PA]MCW8309120.1 hypothetical protein [Acidiphilium sp. PA]
MTPIERQSARAVHADAQRLLREAHTALASANADHAAAVAKRADLIQQAAAGSGLGAADLVRSAGKVTEAAATAELAEAVHAAAKQREFTLREGAAIADRLDRDDRRTAAIARRIEAAERLDRAVAEARKAMSDMDVAGLEARDAGLQHAQQYSLHLSRERPPADHWGTHAITSLADVERAVHGVMKARAA